MLGFLPRGCTGCLCCVWQGGCCSPKQRPVYKNRRLPQQGPGSIASAFPLHFLCISSLPPSLRTHRITITNFCLGKHLVSEGDLLKDQRGSPAYISPDVLSGMCDPMWCGSALLEQMVIMGQDLD